MPIEKQQNVPKQIQQAEENPAVAIYDLIEGTHDLLTNWAFVELWVQSGNGDLDNRRILTDALRRDLNLIQELSIAVNSRSLKFHTVWESPKFRAAYFRYRALKAAGLFEYLENQNNKDGVDALENDNTFYLPDKNLDPSDVDRDEFLAQSRMILINIELELDDRKHHELLEVLQYLVNTNAQINNNLDLHELKYLLQSKSTQNGRSNAWKDLCNLVQKNPDIMLMILGRPVDHVDSPLIGADGLLAYKKELQQNRHNFLNIAIFNTLSLMYQSDNSAQQRKSKEILEEFYGDLPSDFDYEAQMLKLELEIREIVRSVENEEDKEILEAGLILFKRAGFFHPAPKIIRRLKSIDFLEFAKALQRENLRRRKAGLEEIELTRLDLLEELEQELWVKNIKKALEERPNLHEQKTLKTLWYKVAKVDIRDILKSEAQLLEKYDQEVQSSIDVLRIIQFILSSTDVANIRPADEKYRLNMSQLDLTRIRDNYKDFSQIHFKGTDLSNIDFSETSFEGVRFYASIYSSKSRSEGTVFGFAGPFSEPNNGEDEVVFKGVNLSSTSFRGCKFINTTFEEGTIFHQTDFSGASFIGNIGKITIYWKGYRYFAQPRDFRQVMRDGEVKYKPEGASFKDLKKEMQDYTHPPIIFDSTI